MTNIVILSFMLSTNTPAIDFTAGGFTGVFQSSNRCHSAILIFVGPTNGYYEVQWQPYIGHGYLTLNPKYTNGTGTMTVQVPLRTNDSTSYLRLRQTQ